MSQKSLQKKKFNKDLVYALQIQEMMNTEGWKHAEKILKDMIFEIVGGVEGENINLGRANSIIDKDNLLILLSRKEGLAEFYNKLKDIISKIDYLKGNLKELA